MTARTVLAGLAGLAIAAPAAAQDEAPRHSIGTDISYSSNADDTEVVRLGLNADVRYRSEEDYLGLRLERNIYRPSGLDRRHDSRVYLRLARPIGDWKASSTIGTDGHNVYGSASLHDDSPWRKEVFVERDKVETPIGVSRPITYTFAGAALDLPLAKSTQATVLGGVQTFTGDNVRTHLRANFIQVVQPDWGLSLQLRTRYFHNSVPREYDYFSPRWYAEVLPMVQVRRFVGGWRALAAAGFGAQRDNASDWRQSRYLNLRLTSPQDRMGWALNTDLTYSNLPVTNFSDRYSYFRVTAGLARHF